MKFVTILLLALTAMMASLAPTVAAERVIVVLDGSGSMWAQIDGTSRIAIARDTLRTVVDNLPDGIELGLMTYGDRRKGDCDDIHLLVPPGVDNGDAIIAAADALNPKGMTPISAAVQQAADALRYTEEKATVILITDGLENCAADPCALATELKSKGVDFTTHVLGFGLTNEEADKVRCLADNTGGKYLTTNDAASLTEGLGTVIQEVAEPVVEEQEEEPPPPPVTDELAYNFAPHMMLSEEGPVVGNNYNIFYEIYPVTSKGHMGERLTTGYGSDYHDKLPPGDYIVRAGWDYASVDMPVTITADELAEPTFVLNAGTLKLHPRPAPDAEIDGSAAVIISLPNGDTTTYYGDTVAVVPAGPQSITVEIGTGSTTETFDLAAGDTVEKDIIVGIGHVIANAYYTDDISEDMKVTDSNLVVEILKAKKRVDGSQESITTNYGPDTGFDLPPGDYVARITLDQTSVDEPFTAETGELTEINAVLNAGVLYVSAPGADRILITSDKKNIQGKYKELAYGYSDEFQSTLPAGHYRIEVTLADGSGTMIGEGTVTAGERTEVTIDSSEEK